MSIANVVSRFGVILLFALVGACGGGASRDGGASPDGGGSREWPTAGTPAHTAEGGLDLTVVKPVAGEASPLQVLELTGLPSDFEIADLYVEFYVKEGEAPLKGQVDEFRLLPVFELDQTFFLAMPLLDAEGAVIVWRLTDGNSTSETFETQIDALPPPRVGSVDTLLEGAEAVLREATEALGRSYPDEWEGWSDNLDQMPVHLIPLWQSWHAMFDKQNELAWINQPMPDDVRVMLERVLAAQPMDETMFGMAAYFAEGHSLLNDASDLLPVRTNSGVSARSYMRYTGEEPGRIIRQQGMMPIGNALALAAELEKYDQARRSLRNMGLFDKYVGSYISAVGILAALPVAAGTGGGAAAAITAARRELMAKVSNIVLFLSRVNGVAKITSPCCIVSLDVTLDPKSGQVTEDMPESQIWLNDARARAESEPVNITRDIADAIVKDAAKMISVGMSKELAEVYGDAVQRSGIVGDVGGKIIDYAASGIGKRFLASFPVGADMSFFWNDVDLMYGEPQKWLEVEAASLSGSADQSIVEQTPTGQHEMAFRLRTPQAFHLQTSLLRFNTRPEELPAVAPAITTKRISLDYLDLKFNPSVLRVEDGPVDFSLTLENASSLGVGGGEDYIDVNAFLNGFAVGSVAYHGRSGAVMHFTYMPPEGGFPEDLLLEVEANVDLDTGIRAPSHNPPPRRGVLLVTGGEGTQRLEISPPSKCIQEGEQQQFTVTGLGGEPVPVNWRVDGPGWITAEGLYTAGEANGTGQVAITASVQGNDTITAVAHMTVGDCTCWWDGQVGGDFQQQAVGETQWIEVDDQNSIVAMKHHSGDFSLLHLDLSEDPIAPGATGTYRAVVQPGHFGNTLPSARSVWYNPSSQMADAAGLTPIPKAIVQVTRHDMLNYPDDMGVADGARMLEARVTGTVVYEWLEYEPNRIERVSGNLNVGIRGSYWIDLGFGINCSRGL
ncbi:hypothetical protein GCM10007426_09840 [Alloalcanivorax dieselolei]|nr:hypothetical protein GCM10007426_09840 [Alloalcanivorax dieselolei]